MDAARLQASMARVMAHGGGPVALEFYSDVFVQNSGISDMFPASMAAQRQQFVEALIYVVAHVHEIDKVIPKLQELGRDHRKYGVTAEHYPLIGISLLAIIEIFDGQWDEHIAEDWRQAYRVVSKVMMDAAAKDEASGLPPWYDAEVVGHDQPTPGVAVLTLRPSQRVPYIPGQSISVHTPAAPAIWRYYSPANAHREDDTIELHVRAIETGWASNALVYATTKTDTLRLGAPVGGLQVDRDNDEDIIMLAGGTGLAPLRAIVEDLARYRHRRRVFFYVGARHVSELYDLATLRSHARVLPWLTVLPVVAAGQASGCYYGDPAEVAVSHQAQLGVRWTAADVYVCGSPGMVTRSQQILDAAGVPRDRVQRETYSYNRWR